MQYGKINFEIHMEKYIDRVIMEIILEIKINSQVFNFQYLTAM